MNGTRALAIAVVVMLCGTYVIVGNAEGGWESPGQDETYTMDWLAMNTDSVEYGVGENAYDIVDDITITETNTIRIDAGEHLLFATDKSMVVDGNLEVDGTQNQPVTIGTISDEPATVNSIDWTYSEYPYNIIDISHASIDDATVKIEDEDGNVGSYGNAYTDDEPPIPLWGQTQLDITGPPEPVCVRFDKITVWEEYWNKCFTDDLDTDGLPDYWELQGHVTNPDNDDDNDGARNIEEYYHGSDPWDPDTDTDGLQDGFEIHIQPPNNIYRTNPTMIDTDGEGLDDFEEVYNGVDGYKTNPRNKHSDTDTWDDYKESQEGTNPNDEDTDGDDLPDNRDNEPLDFNRRFMFIFEVNEYYQKSDLDAEINGVANDMDDMGWDVYLYTDLDYGASLNAGVEDTIYDQGEGYCTWGNFQNAWDDFDSIVGTPPMENGKDIVFIYLDGHGSTTGNIWTMYFYNDPVDLPRTEIAIRNEMNTLEAAVDIIWLNTDNSVGAVQGTGPINDNWYADDEIEADACIFIATDADFGGGEGEMEDNLDPWDEFYSDYGASPENGFDDAWNGLDGFNYHGMWDNYYDYDEFYLW